MRVKLYSRVISGAFIDRPNRFIAHVGTAEGPETCHVKNTGRCRELLVPGAEVTLAAAENPARKTRWDLVAVRKGGLYINMDSQAPNRAVREALPRLFPGLERVRPEAVWGGSRLDFYLETEKRKIFLEVKGVTLEENGAALFPDAPTERGARHLRELAACREAGFEAEILFLIQMKGPALFRPNEKTDPAFAQALRRARDAGVRLTAYDCTVFPEGMTLDQPVDICLDPT